MKALKTWVFIVLLIISAINVNAWPIPDTGQTKCYDNTAEIPCPAPGEAFYGQDGNYNINPPSYTKLDASGNTLADDATSWVMVQDKVTGLIWENKTNDGSIHDSAKTFTWCDRNSATNGGNQGTCGTGTGDAATDTEAFIKALNDANFGGFSDWRIPTAKELTTIVDWSRRMPAIDTTWFSNTLDVFYWSSTTYSAPTYSNLDWCVSFWDGQLYSLDKSLPYYAVRAVHGRQIDIDNNYVDNGDGTVTDKATGLMWQQETTMIRRNWQAALEYAEALTLAGYDDWRLPAVTELQSIVDYQHYNPSIDMTVFPTTWGDIYWASSTFAAVSWRVDFNNGIVLSNSKLDGYFVRAVRGGQPPPGDINGDTLVTLTDAILALQFASGIKPATGSVQAGYAPTSGDVNSDGKVGVAEAIYILQKVAGIRQDTSPGGTFTLTSTAFTEGATIPTRYTYNLAGQCAGENVSPALAWTNPPANTQSFTIIMHDPDAGNWVHWVQFNIPAGTTGLVEVAGGPDVGVKGRNDFGGLGYGGPCPPSGSHQYIFTVYALDTAFGLPQGATRGQVDTAMTGHILGQVTLTGRRN